MSSYALSEKDMTDAVESSPQPAMTNKVYQPAAGNSTATSSGPASQKLNVGKASSKIPSGYVVVSAYVPPAKRTGATASSDSAIASSRSMADKDWRSNRSGSTEPIAQGSVNDSYSGQTVSKTSVENNHMSPAIGNSNSGKLVKITAEEAQSKFPASSCVFVANLPFQHTEKDLANALEEIFGEFGDPCWATIHRDGKNNPYAHVQFATDEEAKNALEKGRGVPIFGRPCRTEPSRANGTFFVSKKDCSDITEDEVRQFLRPMGPLENVWEPSKSELAMLGTGLLSNGLLAKAKFFVSIPKALTELSNNSGYKIVPFKNNYKQVHLQSSDFDERTSIFVGHLPPGTDYKMVVELFGPFGSIKKITVQQKPSDYENMPDNCFGFVEYASIKEKDMAVHHMDKHQIGRYALRVCTKEKEDRVRHRNGAYTRGHNGDRVGNPNPRNAEPLSVENLRIHNDTQHGPQQSVRPLAEPTPPDSGRPKAFVEIFLESLAKEAKRMSPTEQNLLVQRIQAAYPGTHAFSPNGPHGGAYVANPHAAYAGANVVSNNGFYAQNAPYTGTNGVYNGGSHAPQNAGYTGPSGFSYGGFCDAQYPIPQYSCGNAVYDTTGGIGSRNGPYGHFYASDMYTSAISAPATAPEQTQPDKHTTITVAAPTTPNKPIQVRTPGAPGRKRSEDGLDLRIARTGEFLKSLASGAQ